MVRQYPYRLWAFVTEEPAKTETGDYKKPNTVWQDMAKCRDESNTQVRTVTLQDSTSSAFDTVIYLPKSATKLEEGTQIEVRDGETVRITGTVKRFTSEQLHCRLWV